MYTCIVILFVSDEAQDEARKKLNGDSHDLAFEKYLFTDEDDEQNTGYEY